MCAVTQDHLAYDFTSEENKLKWKGMFVSSLEKVDFIQLITILFRFTLVYSLMLCYSIPVFPNIFLAMEPFWFDFLCNLSYDKQGSILNESNEVRNCWKEYVDSQGILADISQIWE